MSTLNVCDPKLNLLFIYFENLSPAFLLLQGPTILNIHDKIHYKPIKINSSPKYTWWEKLEKKFKTELKHI